MAASTWTWIGTTNNPQLASNWTLTSGPGNAMNGPQSGDTAIIPGNTPQSPLLQDAQLTAVTLDLTGSGAITISNDSTSSVSSYIDSSSLIDSTGTATAISLDGPVTNFGTIAVTGAQASLGIGIHAGSAAAGTLVNDGQIVVDGGSLSINGGTIADPGSLTVTDGSATLAAALVGQSNFYLQQNGTLELYQDATGGADMQVTFASNDSGEVLKLDNPGLFNGSIAGLGSGATIDLGIVNITTIEFDGSGDLIAIGNGGSTVFATVLNGIDTPGTATSFTMSGTGGIAGDFQVTEGGGGDTTLTVLPATTWLWANGASGSAGTAANWSVYSGPGNGWDLPQAGDSAIDAGGTINFGSNANLTSNTIYAGGTSGSPAVLIMTGGTETNSNKPAIDGNSAIVSAVPGATLAETTVLDAYASFVNEGTIAADGPAGSSFTIAIAGTTVNGTFVPGAFINESQIEIDAGNSMTISVAGTSALYNAGDIFVNGGSLLITAASNGLAGGYAPTAGAVIIAGGGTAAINVGYSSTVSGIVPVYAFADDTAGNTLKIENIGSFGGEILGFGVGDTIDLGTLIAVSKIVLSGASGVMALENAGGTIEASLQFASGAFIANASTTETIAVSGTSAGVFNIITGADGYTQLTTSVAVDDAADTSGAWQTAGLWSNGVPGAQDTALIGAGASSPFTLTTGGSSVTVGQLSVVSDTATLQVTSDTTVSLYPIQQFAGSIAVAPGNTLTAPALAMSGGTLAIDAGGVVDLYGRAVDGATPNYNIVGANGNTISVSNTGTAAIEIGSGTLLVNGGTLDAGIGQSGGDGGRIYIGYEGSGTPEIVTVQNSGTAAGLVTDTYAIVASDPTSFGVLTLNGNATWTDQIDPHDTVDTRGYMIVGYNGQANNSGTSTPIYSGAGTLVVENGATLTEQSYAEVGANTDSAGTVTVSDATWNIGTATGGFLDVGLGGAGALTVTNDATVAIGGSGTFFLNGTSFTGSGVSLGGSIGAAGSVVVSGDGSVLTEKAGMNVGQAGTGDLQILNGGSIQLNGTAGISIGTSSGASGTLLVSGVDPNTGAGAQLVLAAGSKGISAGASGSGTLDVESGGTILMNGTGGIAVAQSLGATGLVIVNGFGALIEQGSSGGGMGIGQGGPGTSGTVVIENGGSIILNGSGTSAGVGVGQSANAVGLLVVSGSGALLADSAGNAGLTVGGAGQGTADVDAGGTVVVTGTGIGIGATSSGSGTLNVSGGTVSVTGTNGGINVGLNGSGSLVVSNGGLITVSGTSASFNVGLNSGGSGSVTINNGTLATAGYFGVGNTNASGTLFVGTGGTLINQSATTFPVINATGTGHAVAMVQGGTWLAGTGLIIGNTGTGSLDISAAGIVNVGTGSVFLGNGTNGGSGTLTVENGGTLLGGDLSIANVVTGSATGLVDIGGGGVVDVGEVFAAGGGTVVVGGGTGPAVLDATGSGLTIGQAGSGVATMTIGSGGTVDATGTATADIGTFGTTGGTVTVLGGGTLTAAALGVGGNGAVSQVSVDAGGLLILNGGTTLYTSVGFGTGGSGSLIINGGTVTQNGGGFEVGGISASGSLVVTGGGLLSTTNSGSFGLAGQIGTGGTGIASALVSGGTWDVNGQFAVGSGGSGSLDINSSGLVNAGTNTVQIGNGDSGTITLENGGTLEGGGLNIANVFGTAVAAGLLSVGSGGQVILNGGTQGSNIGSGAGTISGSSGTLLISGGTVSDTGSFFGVGGSNISGGLTIQSGGLLTTTATSNGEFTGSAGDINSTGTATATAIVSHGTWIANGQLIVGDSGEGTLTIGNNGLVSAGNIVVGNVGGGAGTIAVQSGGTLSGTMLSVASSFNGAATGSVTINGDGTADFSGVQVSGGGTITVGGGSGPAVLSSSGPVTIGQAGTGGVLTVDANGTIAITGTSGLAVGFNAGATGVVAVNGGSLQTQGLSFGGGTGTVEVQDGGVLSNSGNSINIAAVGGTGTLVVQDGTVLDSGTFFGVGGFNGAGSLVVGSGGSLVNSGSLEFADINATGTGAAAATVSGGRWTVGGELIVGDSGTGSLDINSNGLVDVGTGSVIIGNQDDSSGTISLESGGILRAGSLAIDGPDDDGSGGGVVTYTAYGTPVFSSMGLLAVGSDATIAISGGIAIGADGTLVMQGGTVGGGTVTIASSPIAQGGFGVVSAAAIDNDGTIYASGGTLTLDTAVVQAATLDGTGELAIDSGADLVVTGAVDASQSVDFAGPGTLTLGDISQFTPVDINGFGAGDTIVVTGVTSLDQSFNPGTDQLVLTDQLGNHYTLQFTGSLTAASFTNAVFPPPGAAQTATWSQDLAGDFDDPSKWSTGSIPGVTTNAVIDYADQPLVVHDTGADTVASLTNQSGDFVMSGGTLTAGTLTNDSLLSWTGGALVLNPGTADAATLDNAAGGTLAIAANGQRLSGVGSGSITLANAGTIAVQGAAGTASIDTGFANTGMLSVTQGTLSLNGGGSSNGYNISIGPNGVLQFGTTASGASNVFTVTGGFFAPGNAAISGGTLDVSAAAVVVFADALAISAGMLATGTLAAAAQDTFDQSGGTLDAAGTLSVYGAAALTGGVQTGTGVTDLLGTTLIGGGIDLDDGHTLLNQGRLNWSSGNIVLGAGDAGAAVQGGTLANAAGGLLYVTADGTITAPGLAAFDNIGAMVVYAGAGTTAIDAALSGGGVIQLQSGTLSLNGGGSLDASDLFANPAAVLQVGTTATGASHTLSVTGAYIVPDTVVNGGTLDLSGATTVVFPSLLSLEAGALALGGQSAADQDAFSQTGGTLSGSGTLTVYGSANLGGGVETGSGVTQLLGVSGIGGGFALDGGRTLATSAWLNWSSGNIALGSGDPGAANQAGTLAIGASGVLYATADGRIGGSGAVANAGVLAVLAGSGTTSIDAALDNTGVVQVQSGTLSLNGGGSSDGSDLFVASGAVLAFGTPASGSGGAFVVTGGVYTVGSTVVNGGTLDLSGAVAAGFGTSLTLSGGVMQLGTLAASSGVLVQSGGTLAGAGFFFVGGAAALSGGVETGGGVTVLTAASSVSDLSLDGGRELANDSTLVWTGGTIALGSGDTETTDHTAALGNSGTLVIAGTGTISGAAGLVVNSGLIEQVGGLGDTTVAAGVANSGTVLVSSGGLTFAQGVSGGGSFELAGTATLDFVSGVSGGGAMTFLAPGGTLETQALGTFGAVVSGFGSGDVLDLASVASGTATRMFNAGTLTVSDGTNSAAFVLVGTYSTSDFVLAADGHGGTRVSFG